MTSHIFTEIDHGIYLLRLPLPFRLNHVNCYLIEGKKGWTVIDAGWCDQSTAEIWQEILGGRSVEKIIITHEHPDHYGYAATLQRATSAPVYISSPSLKSARRFWSPDYLEALKTFYLRSGLTEEQANILPNMTNVIEGISGHPENPHFLEDGQRVNLGDESYLILHTPGHAEGLVCFYHPERKLLFSTDHLLPHITPNISYWPGGDPNPLHTYLQALNRIKGLAIEKALPSHGEPFDHVEERIGQILSHHEERLEQLMDHARNWSTVYQAYMCLFGSKALTPYDISFAVGETVAHLEYLVHQGELIKEESKEGVWRYRQS